MVWGVSKTQRCAEGQAPGMEEGSVSGRRCVWTTEAQKRHGFVLKRVYNFTTEEMSPVGS